MKRLIAIFSALASGVLILLVKLYQLALSPLLGRNCRFSPTCSNYFIGAVRKHGLFVGSWQGVKRIFRCHPFSRGPFYDPP